MKDRLRSRNRFDRRRDRGPVLSAPRPRPTPDQWRIHEDLCRRQESGEGLKFNQLRALIDIRIEMGLAAGVRQ